MYRNFIWIIAMVLLAGVVLAAAPTSPTTITPANNSVFLNDFQLVCSGSTDGDSDPITYAFYGNHHINDFDAEDLTINGSANIVGNYFSITSNNGVSGVYGNTYFVADNLTFEYTTESGDATSKLNINGTQIWTSAAGVAKTNVTLNVSQYQGETYKIAFITTNPNPGNEYFRVNLTTPFLSGNNSIRLLQNQTANNFNISRDFLSERAFIWECRACDDTGDCSAYVGQNRTIYKANFTACGGGNHSVALNASFLDEENQTNITTAMSWNITLTSNTGSNYNFFGLLENNSQYHLCLEPAIEEVKLNITGILDYIPQASGYSFARQYYFESAEITGGYLQNISMYSLIDGLASAVTFEVTRFATPVSDVLIHLQRYRPSEGIYSLVAMARTNSFGEDLIYLRLTDAFYRVLAYENGNLVYSSDAEHITSSPYEISLGGGEGGEDNTSQTYQNFNDINWNITFNASGTNFVVLTADDSTGATSSMCLRVNKMNFNQTGMVSYQCVTTASATISYQITDLNSLYEAQFIAFDNDEWRLIGSITIDLTSGLGDLIGREGVFLAFVLIGLLAFTALYSPIASVLMALLGILAAKIIGFITISPVAIVGIIFVGVLLIIKLRR